MTADLYTILACDPGPTLTGWALVEPTPRGRVRYMDGGKFTSKPAQFFDLLARIRDGRGIILDVVAVEAPEGYVHEHKRGKDLLATSNRAGGFAWSIAALQWSGTGTVAKKTEIYEFSATQWREHIFGHGRGNPKDADTLVTKACAMFVDDLPKVTNEHVRDAIGASIFAAAIFFRTRRPALSARAV